MRPDPLAYLTAKTNGLSDLALEILEEAGLTEADVDDVPDFGTSTLKPPPVITPITDHIWPTLNKGESFFDRALANGNLEMTEGEGSYVNGISGNAATSALDDWARDAENVDDVDPEEGGWDLGGGDAPQEEAETEAAVTVEEEPDTGAGASPGVKETELWVRNSPFPADHVAAGSFESAMQACVLSFNYYWSCV